MELSQDQYTTYMSDGELMSFGRDGISYLWSNAEIPVTFDDATIAVSSSGRQLVEGTMSEMNKELCGCFHFRYIHGHRIEVCKFFNSYLIQFHFRPAKLSDFNRVLIKNDPREEKNVCQSYVGMQNGTQDLQLGNRCFQKKVVQHELLHSAGIYHEHARPDRDEYIHVNEDCIMSDDMYKNFKIQETARTYGLAYNPKSIMHYDSKSGAGKGCRTITSKVHFVFM